MPAESHTNILLVDDEEHIRKIVSLLLRHAGYHVTLAMDGEEALARVAEALPDLIITDVMMPNMDGFDFLRRLRANAKTQAIPVIMLTAKGATTDIVSGLNFGADDYLAKPFETAELLARVRSKISRPPVPSADLMRDRQTGLFSERLFVEEARREIQRARRSRKVGCLAYLNLAELENLQEQYDYQVGAAVAKQLAELFAAEMRPLDIVGRDRDGYFQLLLPETNVESAQRNLQALAKTIATYTFKARGLQLHLTPLIGFTSFLKDKDFAAARGEALMALDYATTQLDLVPKLYEPAMGHQRQHAAATRWDKLRRRWSSPVQFALMVVMGWIIPFLIYAWCDFIGRDITTVMYVVVVFALSITAALIWLEGLLALQRVDPPDPPRKTYPAASAIIAAYLPNEASTIIETVHAFLALDYPAHLQIILAYNTPTTLPVESRLADLAKHDPRLVVLRIEGSTSKAQNVNAALAHVQGEFVGIFDADHHPQAQNFKRAWHWLASECDVVQGHCLVRNGAEAWVAQMVAVEFEAIYAVSHPGRARLYDFGVFGGSNGYWKTELLRETRLHGFMLTEDIDSSLRITEAGYKIISDPLLISRELAPLTLPALWHQRMRWAQGWYQVSLRYLFRALLSWRLSWRQKLGVLWLLGWREFYPWLSVQMFPLITYWVFKYGGLDKLDWLVPIFVLTTLFTFSVGPSQALFAYFLAAPEIQANKSWFVRYLINSILFYTEFKNTIGRIAQIKELMGERQWKITPRARTKTMQADGH